MNQQRGQKAKKKKASTFFFVFAKQQMHLRKRMHTYDNTLGRGYNSSLLILSVISQGERTQVYWEAGMLRCGAQMADKVQ